MGRRICKILEFELDHLPSSYLGVPFFMGSNKSSYWNNIIRRIKSRTMSWKVRWLTLSGRIMLIKSVLAAIPNYFFSVLSAPMNVIKQIESIIRGFLWADNMTGVKKIPLISLNEMAIDKSSGGVNLPNMQSRNKAFGAKLVWLMYERADAKWCKIMQWKYLDTSAPSRIFTLENLPKGSAIWNFMADSWALISKYLSWKVNKGSTVLFWEDSWNGLPPLTTLYSFRLWKHIFCQCWGVHVQDYFKEVDPTSGLVTWKNPDDLPIPKEIKNDFVNECKSRMVLVSSFNDELIWAPTQEGKYSVKMGCLAISHQILDIKKSRAFMFCWNSIVLPKAGCFSWLALRKRILTGDRLQKLNIVQNFKCVLCLEELESVDHLFVQCKVAQECWSFVLQKLNVMFPLPNTLWDLFNGWPSSNNHSFYACLWKCIPASIIWALWWERNKCIFR